MGSATRRLMFLSTPFPVFHPRPSLLHLARRSLCSFSPRVSVSAARRRRLGFSITASNHLQCHVATASTRDDNIGDHFVSSLNSSRTWHSWPEWSRLVEALNTGGYIGRALSDYDAFVRSEGLSDEFVRAAIACLGFCRNNPNALGSLSRRDIRVVVDNGSPFLFSSGFDSVRRLKAFLAGGESNRVCANLTKALASTKSRHVSSPLSAPILEDLLRPIPSFIKRVPKSSTTSSSFGVDNCKISPVRPLIRHFHGSPGLLARRRDSESFGLKTPKKEKYVKRESKMQPPVEAPYVPPKPKKSTKSLSDRTIEIFEGMTIGELAKRTNESISTLLEMLVNIGENFDSEFDTLSIDIAELVAMETGVNVRRLHSNEGAEILPRPAVVTVMGHVDHGKTSLLDALRQTSVAAREAGGITQHLGAFVVSMPSGASITFLDTPGHAAFSAMRARGAAVTDIVVLVVAADDGVMPQTLEAMSHAKAANVPIVVAINKCDRPAADPERVKIQLASEGLLLEEMGGDVQVVEVSAVNKTGLDNLEEALLLQAEVMDLKARIDGPAQAYVVEARLDRGRGPLATAIVKAGTLVGGQYVVVGAEWGRIRAIRDMTGNLTDLARPAMPVEIEGLRGLPMAGDDFIVVESEERARMLSGGRKKKYEKDRLRKMDEGRIEAPEPSEDMPERVELPIVVKADVQGTVQAVTDALKTLNSPQVFVNVVHVGVGPISQSDVDLAQACGACIVGFNVKNPPTSLGLAASRAGIQIKVHRVIYHLLEDIGNLIVDKAPGTSETQVAGEAQVLNIFELKGRSKSKGEDVKIAGCRVIDGRVTKSSTMRLLRSGEVMFEGSCVSLKREKQDVDTVGKGNECGLVIGNWDDFQIGDVIQCLEQVVRKPKFISSESGAVRIEC